MPGTISPGAASRLELEHERQRMDAMEAALLGQINDAIEGAVNFNWPDALENPYGPGQVDKAVSDAIQDALPFHSPQWPPYSDMEEAAAIREASRLLGTYNEYAQGALRNRQNFVCGWGWTVSLRGVDGEDVTATDRAALTAWLKDFGRRNNWIRRQRATQLRLDRDGEVFIRKFRDRQGNLVLRFVWPDQVKPPMGLEREAPYGIEYAGDDMETPLQYWVDGNPVDAADMQHRKLDDDFGLPRGLPFLFAVRRALGSAAKISRNVSALSVIQAAIAMIRKHKLATVAAIQNIVAANADVTVKDGTTGKTRQGTAYVPGTILDATDDVDYEFPAQGANPGAFMPPMEALLRAAAAALVMPEFMLTADASNNSYASTMVAEGPAVRAFQAAQQDAIEYDLEILRTEIELQSAKGTLPAGILERVEVCLEPMSPAVRDTMVEAQARQIDMEAGILSPQTATAETGRDYETEQENIETHAERYGLVAGMGKPTMPQPEPDPAPAPAAGQAAAGS